MDLTAPVDIYCERLDASFWSEPLNAVSNAAFILAALWAAFEARRRRLHWPSIWLLIVLAALIGVGSFLFHTFATGWSALTDVLPIWGFVLAYALISIAHLGGVAPRRIAFVLAALVALGVLFWIALPAPDPAQAPVPRAPDRFNGSGQYLPAVIAMVIWSVIAVARRHPVRWWFVAATGTFMLSLSLRTYDIALCDVWPYGTHVFWHLLNGTMIALLLQALIRNTNKETSP
ncbi:ceramidase domain-containing protein [Sulfitobacter sp. JB4-11]|uniref:ceramidase domain-containing protein n=1 Tax=Sulfitobacter rhodophyticola TaxID=3238304 RepID=UPI003D81968D